MTTNTDNIILSEDQDNLLTLFYEFLSDPTEQVFVMAGYSGTGKSTLIRVLLDRLPGYIKATRLIWPQYPEYQLQLTATTNKAADTFGQITGMDVSTIHSFLGLFVYTDYVAGTKELKAKKENEPKQNYLLFIDEASYIDSHTLKLIFQQTKHCKIVFVGDDAQLLQVKSATAPVFAAGFKGGKLTKVMRQMVDGKPKENPITDLATAFRLTVGGAPWPQFKPDGHYVKYLERSDFEDAILAEFKRPDWKYHDSKVLAYTNNCVIAYNNAIRKHVQGTPHLQVGDYAECNSFVVNGKSSVKTDQLVHITDIEPLSEHRGVAGNWVTVDHSSRFFFPKRREDKQEFIKKQRIAGDFTAVRDAENWIDLRSVFAQTVNKAQGSTYHTVFIDLDNLKTCVNANQLARMAYVGISRATTCVIMTGDLV